MNNQQLHDAKISGSGSLGGGLYANIRISGSGNVKGDLDCLSFHTSGSARIHGKIRCQNDLHCSGSVHIDGDVRTGSGHASGSAHIGGNLIAESFHASGACQIDGKVTAGEFHTSGAVRIDSDVEGEFFKASGGCRIAGLLNAERVELYPGLMNIGAIGGSIITVKGRADTDSEGISLKLFGKEILRLSSHGGHGGPSRLECETIEGDEITLENTTASIVRGKTVTVGRNCIINRVEYSESLSVTDNGEVKESIKME